MFKFLLKRILQVLPSLVCISLLAFFILRLVPGDPIQQMLGERGATPEMVEQMRAKYGMDKPLYLQYLYFLKQVFQGDFGKSIMTGQDVSKEFFTHFPATVELSIFALLLALIFGLPLGILSALKKDKLLDRTVMACSLFGFSMSVFWWGLMLILIFSVTLGWTPVSGRIDVAYDLESITGFYLIDAWFSEESLQAFWSALKHLILPSLTLSMIPFVFIVRMTRASFLEVLEKDYIRTAVSKGLGFKKIWFHHAFFPSLIPILTLIGFLFSMLLTGAVLTETIFSWPGLGHWFVRGVLSRDYPVITGGVFLMALFIIVLNILVDVLYVRINPQVRDVLLQGKQA